MRANDYYGDWTPVNKDKKWYELVEAFKHGLSLDSISPARPIHILKLGDEYWVGNDGNRRVALAKINRVKTLNCEVNEIII